MSLLDGVLNRVTTYRLVLYVLLGYIAAGALLADRGGLAFSPGELLGSAAFLVLICWAANTLLAGIFRVPANVESAILTALILALIFDPARSLGDLAILGWAGILAMGSKYVLAIYNKHIFNPAAIAAVIVAFALNDAASWWVGTAWMLPVVLAGGFLIVRKTRLEELFGGFVLAALVTATLVSTVLDVSVGGEVRRLVAESPLVFMGTVMLTEPLTMPPTRELRTVYAIIAGCLVIPQLHLGSVYSTPELALIVANVFAYLVSPKRRFRLTLNQRRLAARDTIDFAFALPGGLSYRPGQYMEWTLHHSGTDRRGNRRYFTIASSPTEPELRLGVRVGSRRSSFKQALMRVRKDDSTSILAGQVAGDFTLPANANEKLVFIAGGIGITPYRSMLKYLIDTGQKRDIILIYSNARADEIAYRDVLQAAQAGLGVRIIYTLTDLSAVPAGWTGCTGRIDAEMLIRLVPDFAERTFYLSGPPGMVRAVERALHTLPVKRGRIKLDAFAGLR